MSYMGKHIEVKQDMLNSLADGRYEWNLNMGDMNEIWISNQLILEIDIRCISNEITLGWLLLDLTDGMSGNKPLPESMLDLCDHVPY